jgi:octaprenyl-diphosphate synthase
MTGLKETLMSRVKDDLSAIEAALDQSLDPHVGLVRDVAGHLIFSGGKRIRPLLNVLSARLCGYTDPFIYPFSTIVEFLHTATLLHDDVVDGADLRRGKPVAHLLYGAPVTVLVGDFLLARGLSIAAKTGDPEIIRVIADITENMCQGEIRQLVRKGDTTLTEAEYLDVIQRKTGFLIQGACETGALIAGAAPETAKSLARFGYHVGMVFQISDDLLDYTADTRNLGKTVGADLREGKLTLPVIHALQNATGTDRKWMEQIIGHPDFTAAEFSRLVEHLRYYGGIDYAVGIARGHVSDAADIMDAFDPSETRDTLVMIAEYTLERHA